MPQPKPKPRPQGLVLVDDAWVKAEFVKLKTAAEGSHIAEAPKLRPPRASLEGQASGHAEATPEAAYKAPTNVLAAPGLTEQSKLWMEALPPPPRMAQEQQPAQVLHVDQAALAVPAPSMAPAAPAAPSTMPAVPAPPAMPAAEEAEAAARQSTMQAALQMPAVPPARATQASVQAAVTA